MLIYLNNFGKGRSRAAPNSHIGEICFFSFEFGFDSPVMTVAHPSAESQAFCLRVGAVAKTNALHSAVYYHAQPPCFFSLRLHQPPAMT